MAREHAKYLLEQKDEQLGACYVKSCCKQLEGLGFEAPCGYCLNHCVLFWFGTLYIGCEAIDKSWCNRPRESGGEPPPRVKARSARASIHVSYPVGERNE